MTDIHSTDNMQLTAHFKFKELVATVHTDFILENHNYGLLNYDKVLKLAEFAEQVRSILEVPMTITSAIRCPELNKLIGGSETSQHLKIEAIDFIPKDISVEEAFEKIKKSTLQFGQLILEYAGTRKWIHISMPGDRAPERCNMVLKYKDGQYIQIER